MLTLATSAVDGSDTDSDTFPDDLMSQHNCMLGNYILTGPVCSAVSGVDALSFSSLPLSSRLCIVHVSPWMVSYVQGSSSRPLWYAILFPSATIIALFFKVGSTS